MESVWFTRSAICLMVPDRVSMLSERDIMLLFWLPTLSETMSMPLETSSMRCGYLLDGRRLGLRLDRE